MQGTFITKYTHTMRICLLVLLTVLFVGCGARKRAMQLQEERIRTLTTKLATIENNITANIKETKQYRTVILEPVNPTEQSTYNGHTFTNTKVVLDSSTTQKEQVTIDRTVSTTKENQEVDHQKKEKTVNTESKRGDFWRSFSLPVGIGIAVALILFVWFRTKRSNVQ